jgi:hypothetical protein
LTSAGICDVGSYFRGFLLTTIQSGYCISFVLFFDVFLRCPTGVLLVVDYRMTYTFKVVATGQLDAHMCVYRCIPCCACQAFSIFELYVLEGFGVSPPFCQPVVDYEYLIISVTRPITKLSGLISMYEVLLVKEPYPGNHHVT